jgi:hypothetical protein
MPNQRKVKGIFVTNFKIRSGGQNGADLGSVKGAKSVGVSTGGMMPAGFRTLDGDKPEYEELYGMKPHNSWAYPPRTFENVRDSDGTIRFATNMDSAGEKCTMKGIVEYSKPHFDVHIKDVNTFTLPESMHPKAAAKWIVEKQIRELNCAGNSEKTSPGIGKYVERYVVALIAELKALGWINETVKE